MPHEVATESSGTPHEDAPQGPVLRLRDHLLQSLAQPYRVANKGGKSRILDEFIARTGYHRKHAVRLLRDGGTARPRSRFYDQRVQDALVAVWEAAGRPSSRRLKKLLPELVITMERNGDLPRDLLLRGRLVMVSSATIDRILAPVRARTLTEVASKRMERISKLIGELADFKIPDDLPPHERERVEARLVEIAERGQRIARDPRNA